MQRRLLRRKRATASNFRSGACHDAGPPGLPQRNPSGGQNMCTKMPRRTCVKGRTARSRRGQQRCSELGRVPCFYRASCVRPRFRCTAAWSFRSVCVGGHNCELKIHSGSVICTILPLGTTFAPRPPPRIGYGNLRFVSHNRGLSAATTSTKSDLDHASEEGDVMRKAIQLLGELKRDEEGAALVEYTVLLGIMLVAVVATIGLVGGWMSNKWTALWTALSAN